MSTIKVTLDVKGLESRMNTIKDRIMNNSYTITKDVLISIQREIEKNCPVDTGELRDSFTYDLKRIDGMIKGIIVSDKHYLKYVLYGTGIYNKNGRRTPWVYCDRDGNFHYTYGQRPNNFLRRSIDSNRSRLRSYIIARIGEDLK